MTKESSFNRRKRRVRNSIRNAKNKHLRLTVFRSSKHIYAQIIDDLHSKTLVSASSLKDKTDNKKKMNLSVHVAGILAKKALEKKITKVYFDRGSYKYHGRVKIFAETLKKNGLII